MVPPDILQMAREMKNGVTLLLMLELQQSTFMHRNCVLYPLQICTKFAVT